MPAAALALLLLAPAPPGGAPVHLPDRLIPVAPGLFSGAEPAGDAAFAALVTIGVRTVVSVDGPVPDAAAARRFGLRSVHVPIGYDGVPADAAAALAAVMRRFGPAGTDEAGGVFVHCHHGRHRGPAAAAVCGRAAGLLTKSAATALLRRAGTGPRYAGLWASVAAFDPAAVPPGEPELPEAVAPSDLAALMAEAAARLDAAAAGDTDSRLTLVAESLRESARLPGLPADLRAALRDAAAVAGRGDAAAITANCAACHARFRD